MRSSPLLAKIVVLSYADKTSLFPKLAASIPLGGSAENPISIESMTL
jgi:hypothetical protein